MEKLNQGSSTVHTRGDDALRVLLVVVDVDSHQDLLRKLLDFCIKHDLSLVLAWSYEEAANYIALCKQLDKAPLKGRKIIEGTKGSDYNSSVVKAFTGIKLVNKTDVSNLLANCKSVKEIVLQSCQNDNDDGIGLANIPGLGAKNWKILRKYSWNLLFQIKTMIHEVYRLCSFLRINQLVTPADDPSCSCSISITFLLNIKFTVFNNSFFCTRMFFNFLASSSNF